jgi:hypothetical protein
MYIIIKDGQTIQPLMARRQVTSQKVDASFQLNIDDGG